MGEAKSGNWLDLDRSQVLREVISAYEEDLAAERLRGATIRVKLVEMRSTKNDLEKAELARHVEVAGFVAEELQHRLEAADEGVAKIEELLTRFRGELARLEGNEAVRGYLRTGPRRTG